jgi:hypothetical protein
MVVQSWIELTIATENSDFCRRIIAMRSGLSV